MSENPKVAIVIVTWNKKSYVMELLTITKHQSGVKRFLYILNMLRGTGKGVVYSLLSVLNTTAKLLFYGPLDFVRGKFYKSGLSVKTADSPDPESTIIPIDDLKISTVSKVIILPNASYFVIKNMIAKLREQSPSCHISLLIQVDRHELFKDLEIDRFIVFEGYRQSTMQTLAVLKSILEYNYDLCISPSRSLLPFSYAVKKYYLYDHKRNYFVKSKEDIYASWKLFVSFFGGELLAIILMPFVYLKSLAHQ